jgi:antitoxin PrlF
MYVVGRRVDRENRLSLFGCIALKYVSAFLIVLIFLKSINRLKAECYVAMQDETSCCVPDNAGKNSCKVEAVVSVDERGQMVLPKELRDRAQIRAGDKLAVVSCERDSDICCISLIKVEELSATVKGFLGPIFRDML